MLPNFGYRRQVMHTDVKKQGLPQMSANRPSIWFTGKECKELFTDIKHNPPMNRGCWWIPVPREPMDALRKEQRVLDLEWEDRAPNLQPVSCGMVVGNLGWKGRGYGTNCWEEGISILSNSLFAESFKYSTN